MRKIYYQMIFIAKSPFRIGNGRHEFSDSDLMLDGRGLPFIPGTSIAGIIRHLAEEKSGDQTVLNRLFGIVEKAVQRGDSSTAIPSAILVNDAVMAAECTKKDAVIGRRDGVGLGEWGTAKPKSKFDFQISEAEKEFCAIVEWTGDKVQYKTEIEGIIDPIMEHFVCSGFHAGARTSRGYGYFEVKIQKKGFSFPDNLEEWIGFQPYAENAFSEAKELKGKKEDSDVEVEIGFQMMGTFSVRVNTAKTELMEDGSVPDTVPLENHRGNPVIPGTAWAGAFRHHMHGLLRDVGIGEDSAEMRELDMLFGMADNAKNNKRSAITFSESEISIKNEDKQKMSVVRTAIDRFTAAPRDAALFTNRVYSGGSGSLHISFDKNAVSDMHRQLLAACICDLHLGLLSVGGEASVGRGIMQVTKLKVNGCDKLDRIKSCGKGMASLDWLKEENEHAKRMGAAGDM